MKSEFLRIVTDTKDSSCSCVLGLILIVFLVWLVIRQSKKAKETSFTQKESIPLKTVTTKTQSLPKKDVRNFSSSMIDRFVEVAPGTQSSFPRIALSYPVESNSSNFIKDAKRLHNIDGKLVPFTPFMQYWPTFQSFNIAQEKWYFYWRSEVRQGRFPTTDLSYIFVYVYELLCLVETSDPVKAAMQIIKLWRVYRPNYKNLDNYLPEWGGDLITTEVGISQGIAWWWDLLMKDAVRPPAPILNIITQKAVEAGKTNELPYSVWSGLNLYQPQNKFYQKYNQNGLIDQAYLKAINAIDRYFITTKNAKGLLERFTPPSIYSQKKWAFNSAIVPESFRREIYYGDAHNFVSASRLGNLLFAITKYSENILRKQNHFSARLSGFELDKKLQQVLDEAFIAPQAIKAQESYRIALDSGLIEALHLESELVSEMLEAQANIVAKPLYSDIARVRSLWSKLDIPARRLLISIYLHNTDNISQVTEEIVGSEILPFLLIDRINNLSLPILGDRIISVENRNQIMIADDFVDEMELISKENPVESMQIPSPGTLKNKTDDPWQRFFQLLSPDESELLLHFVATGSLREIEIEKFARSRGLMGNLLIDSVSEKAIEQIGRTPFYLEERCWFIEGEDLAVLREIVHIEGD